MRFFIAKLQSGFRSSAPVFIFQALAVLFSLVFSAFVAQWGGATAKGQLDLFLLWVGLIQDLGFVGIGSGLLALYTIHKIPVSKAHGTGLFFCFVCGLTLLLILAPTKSIWMPFFTGLPLGYYFITLLLSPFIFYRLVWNNLALGLGKAYTMQLYAMGFNLLTVVALFLFNVFFDFSISAAFAIYMSSIILSAPFYYVSLKKSDATSLKVDREVCTRSVMLGFSIYLGMVLNLLHYKIDQIMVNTALGVTQLGYYALATRLAEGIFLIENAIVATYWSQIMNPGQPTNVRLFWKVSLFQGAINLLAVLVLFLMGPWLMVTCWGPEFAAAAVPFRVLLPGVFIWSFFKLFANLLVFKLKKSTLVVYISALGLLLNIALNYWFLFKEQMGLFGVALASSLSYTAFASAIGAFATWYLLKTPSSKMDLR